jgi:hypothetical protein
MDQLDLSKYPKIVKPSELEDKEEIERRSQALGQIKELAENLIALITSYIGDLSTFDSKVNILNQRDYALKEAEFAVAQKEKEVYDKQVKLDQEKEYVVNANRDLKEREEKLISDKDYLNEIEVGKQEWEDRKAEALKQEKIVEDKKKSLEALNTKQKELDEKEAMLEKSAQIDAERKRLLDIREERIKVQEQRLHIEQSE